MKKEKSSQEPKIRALGLRYKPSDQNTWDVSKLKQTRPKAQTPKGPSLLRKRPSDTTVLLRDTRCHLTLSKLLSQCGHRPPASQRASVLCERLSQAPARVGKANSITSIEIFIFEAILPSKTKSSKEIPYGTNVPRAT